MSKPKPPVLRVHYFALRMNNFCATLQLAEGVYAAGAVAQTVFLGTDFIVHMCMLQCTSPCERGSGRHQA